VKITIAGVGRMKPGPEKMLVNDYLDRAAAGGRKVAVGPFKVIEIDERKARDHATQCAQLVQSVPAGAVAVVLDERGEALSSKNFAGMLAGLRDGGKAETVFLVGGAEGHDDAVRARADRMLSFGPMVWPHMLARVLLAEQLYRAVSILAGTPYHRA